MKLNIVTGHLPPFDGHEVYYTCYGSPENPTIINVHGGPGLMSKEKYARQFDLERFHVITLDQRGCGQSRYATELAYNTTADLVDDMERLRQHLDIESWFMNGGSWGSTLCLAYTQRYLPHVRGLMLASTFLGDFKRMNWLHGGPHEIAEQWVPSEYAKYRSFLAKFGVDTRPNLGKLVEILAGGQVSDQEEIVRSLIKFERRLYVAEALRPETAAVTKALVATKRIYLHYASNRFFTYEGQFSKDRKSFNDLPMMLVHGALDRVCPLSDIEEFAAGKTGATLRVLAENGHSFTEQGKLRTEEAYATFLADNL